MNILMITPDAYPRVGGVASVVEDIAQHLVRLDNQVTILTDRSPKQLAPEEVHNNLPIFRIRFASWPRSFFQSLRWCIFTCINVGEIISIVKKRNIEIIHIHFFTSRLLAVYISVLLMGKIRMCVSVHGSDVEMFPFLSQSNRFFMDRCLQRASQVIANSSYLLKRTRDIFPKAMENKGEVIYHGVDMPKSVSILPNLPSQKYILVIGRLEAVKGQDVLIDAFPAVLSQYPDLRLCCIGDGPFREKYQKMARQLGIASSIDWVGQLVRADIDAYLQQATMLIVPSRREAFGLVILEAMGAAIPVIASDVGGIPEIITHNETGILFPVGQADALSKAMLDLLSHPEKMQELGRKGQEMVTRQFQWKQICHQYGTIYKSIW